MKHFIDQLRQSGLYLRVAKDRLVLEGDRNLSDEELQAISGNKKVIDYIRTHREELIAYVSTIEQEGCRADDIESVYPLSGLQQGMLFHGLFDEQGGGYIEQLTCDLIDLREDVFRTSWNHLLRRHTILRSSFHHNRYDVPVQYVHREAPMPFAVLDYQEMMPEDREIAFREFQEADRQRGIDLTVPPLMRITLIRLDGRLTRMLWTHHHILTDGWSMQIMIEELLIAYETLIAGREPHIGEIDYYEDLIRYIRSKSKEQEEAYWRKHFQGIEDRGDLPFMKDLAYRNMGVGVYKEQSIHLGPGLTRELTVFARINGLTLNTVMQAVWGYLLGCYTGKNDVIFGVTVSGRPDDLPGVERKVGLYINTIPLCIKIDAEQKLLNWLQTLQFRHVESREFQYTPLNTIQEWLKIPGDLFQTLLVYENFPVSNVASSRKWLLQAGEISIQDHVNYPLSIRVVATPDDISIRFSYNAGLLGDKYVANMAAHFHHVLSQMSELQGSEVGMLEVLTSGETKLLVNEYGSSVVTYPADRSVVELFEQQVAKHRNKTAVVFDAEALSYEELNGRANQLAYYLQDCGVVRGMPVVLCMDRSAAMLTAMLAVLKAGGAYVPVEAYQPASRIQYMLEDIGAAVMITNGPVEVKVAEGIRVVALEKAWPVIAGYPRTDPFAVAGAEDLAYIIYTSGSTGQPKGVMIRHRSLVDYVYGLADRVPVRDCASFALVSALSTDLGNTVVFGSLLTGGILHILAPETVNDAALIAGYFRRHQIDCLKIVPSHWKALSAEGEELIPGRLLIFGGEKLPTEVVARVRSASPDCVIVNHYGPTETTIGKLLHVIEGGRVYRGTVPIGRPFSTTRVYILSKGGNLCPVGVPGELYLAGDGLAAGYWRRPELTLEKFVPDPFSRVPGERMYRTGDRCRWLPDGSIEYLGRQDEQVKIRGYRVEPGEVEVILEQHPGVCQGVVMARQEADETYRLVGYVVAAETFDRAQLMDWLEQRLPEYMVPQLWVALSEMPLTANGKVDRQRLPEPDIAGQLSGQYEAPRTEVEQKLTAIWQELLGIERIGINDNFFTLGGHSLLATRMLSAIRRDFFVVIPMRVLFELTTINVLAKYLELQLTPATTRTGSPQEFTMLDI